MTLGNPGRNWETLGRLDALVGTRRTREDGKFWELDPWWNGKFWEDWENLGEPVALRTLVGEWDELRELIKIINIKLWNK